MYEWPARDVQQFVVNEMRVTPLRKSAMSSLLFWLQLPGTVVASASIKVLSGAAVRTREQVCRKLSAILGLFTQLYGRKSGTFISVPHSSNMIFFCLDIYHNAFFCEHFLVGQSLSFVYFFVSQFFHASNERF